MFSSILNKIYANAFDKSFRYFDVFEFRIDSANLDLIALAFDIGYEEMISF
jgi:hypothetical protein